MKKTNANPVEDFDQKLNKGLSYIWLFLMLGCLAGVIFAGAYWHLFTAGISFVMWRAMSTESTESDD